MVGGWWVVGGWLFVIGWWLVVGWLVGFGGSGASRGEYLSSTVNSYPTLDCPTEELFLLYLCKEVRAP